MRRILVCGLLTLGGCASATRIERSADARSVKAKQLAREGHWQAASKEQAAADKLYSKANTRRGFEDAMPIVFN